MKFPSLKTQRSLNLNKGFARSKTKDSIVPTYRPLEVSKSASIGAGSSAVTADEDLLPTTTDKPDVTTSGSLPQKNGTDDNAMDSSDGVEGPFYKKNTLKRLVKRVASETEKVLAEANEIIRSRSIAGGQVKHLATRSTSFTGRPAAQSSNSETPTTSAARDNIGTYIRPANRQRFMSVDPGVESRPVAATLPKSKLVACSSCCNEVPRPVREKTSDRIFRKLSKTSSYRVIILDFVVSGQSGR